MAADAGAMAAAKQAAVAEAARLAAEREAERLAVGAAEEAEAAEALMPPLPVQLPAAPIGPSRTTTGWAACPPHGTRPPSHPATAAACAARSGGGRSVLKRTLASR